MTKIDENEKIARNSFIGQFLHSEFKSATQIFVNPIHFEIQLILRNYLFSMMTKIDEKRKLPEILSWGNFCVVNSNLQPKFM